MWLPVCFCSNQVKITMEVMNGSSKWPTQIGFPCTASDCQALFCRLIVLFTPIHVLQCGGCHVKTAVHCMIILYLNRLIEERKLSGWFGYLYPSHISIRSRLSGVPTQGGGFIVLTLWFTMHPLRIWPTKKARHNSAWNIISNTVCLQGTSYSWWIFSAVSLMYHPFSSNLAMSEYYSQQ